MDKKILENITIINSVLALLAILSGLLFLSLIFDNGFQLYCVFLLIPAMTLVQLYKIYFVYKSNFPLQLVTTASLMTFAIYIPLSDALFHSTKITYPLSVITYFCMAVYYIRETRNVTSEENQED